MKSLHLFLALACIAERNLSPQVKYTGTLRFRVELFFNYCLKAVTLPNIRTLLSREFHRDIEVGIQDLLEISVRVNGTVKLLLFLKG